MRETTVERKTTEVDIVVQINVDGKGKGNVETGIKFLNHLLITLAKHSLFDLKIKATGDLKHHVSEEASKDLAQPTYPWMTLSPELP